MANILSDYVLNHAATIRLIFFIVLGAVFAFLLCRFIINVVNLKHSGTGFKEKALTVIKDDYLIAAALIVLPVIFEIVLFGNSSLTLFKESYIRLAFFYGSICLCYIYKFLAGKSRRISSILDFVVKYRYRIALLVFVLLVCFRINFSSIGMWDAYTNEGSYSTVFGTPRTIRSDEWLVTTPFNLSQSHSGFSLVNPNLALGNNDMNVFHAPVLDASLPVRVLNWGYYIFGNEIGLSWFWSLKMIALFMFAFELGMILCKKDKAMALLSAIWITFSPAFMWWSVPVEFIFSIGIIVLFHTYVSKPELALWKKLLLAYGLVVCLCNFAYALYPAWQVPLAYLVLAFAIVDFIKHRKNLKKKDYLIMAATILLTLALLAYFVLTSWSGISALMSTKYPGAREATGGEYDFSRLTNYYSNFFTPFSKSFSNPSEISAFIIPCLSVLIVIACYALKILKNKRAKLCLKNSDNRYYIALFAVLTFFALWICLPWPRFLSKITFMSFSVVNRTETVFFLSFLLLAITVANDYFSRKKKLFNKYVSLGISAAISIIAYLIAKNGVLTSFFSSFMLIALALAVFAMNYTLLSCNKKAFVFTMAVISIITGMTVNPITHGISSVTETKIAQAAVSIAAETPDAVWAGELQTNAQYLLANGVKVINGINEYPNYEWIDLIDPEHEYEEAWNRYAHIMISLDDSTPFELLGPDSYRLHLSYTKAKKLNIKYYYSYTKPDQKIIDDYNMTCVYGDDANRQYIYEIG